MTGVIITILMTFIYLVTSSLHRNMMEEHKMLLIMNKNNNKNSNKQKISSSASTTTAMSFVTVVLPSVVNPNGRSKRLHSIEQTWGSDANAIFVIHDLNEYNINNSNNHSNNNSNNNNNSNSREEDEEFSNNHHHHNEPNHQQQQQESSSSSTSTTFPQTLYVPPSIATVDQGVPRLHYVMEQIYNVYNPDYIFFVNDHTFVIPQHICTFLKQQYNNNSSGGGGSRSSDKSDFHLYAGHALKPKGTKYAFNSGAAGYFLSRATMKFLIDSSNSSSSTIKECKGSERKWFQGNPGLVTANCLKEVLDLDPIDTRDEYGRFLFHAYGLIRTVKGDFDSWYTNKHSTLKEIWGEDKKFNYEVKKGKECCSTDTISFHYVEFAETIALYKTFQKIIDVGGSANISNDDLQKFLIDTWPSDKKDIGGYSHNLPPLSKKDIWDDLLYVIKNIAPRSTFNTC